jgi:hypothetical protein
MENKKCSKPPTSNNSLVNYNIEFWDDSPFGDDSPNPKL